jgi:hypothetical protein
MDIDLSPVMPYGHGLPLPRGRVREGAWTYLVKFII